MTIVTDNAAQNRFELELNGETAYAEYHVSDDTLYIDYVFAPPALRGTGAAGKLMAGLIKTVSGRDQKIVPVCSYAAAWLKRHRL